MNAQVLPYIRKERISCLSVSLGNGTIHSAVIHYSHTENPLQFVFNTNRESLKYSPLLSQMAVPASLVIGFSETEWIELQLHGTLSKPLDNAEAARVHFAKYPDYSHHVSDPNRVFMVFTPSWYRYTEFRAKPRIIIEETM